MKRNKKVPTEDYVARLRAIEAQLQSVRCRWNQTADESLIDSYIYEISSLHKQYQYYLRQAKNAGFTAFEGRRHSV